jgi:hypothetical protein
MGDVKVNLPPGCSGFNCQDGTRYKANRPGGSVTVSEEHARAIQTGQYGQKGFITASGAQAFGTKRGRECEACHRVWNVWNHECPRCDRPTVEWGSPTQNE